MIHPRALAEDMEAAARACERARKDMGEALRWDRRPERIEAARESLRQTEAAYSLLWQQHASLCLLRQWDRSTVVIVPQPSEGD